MCGELGAYTDVVQLPLGGRVRSIDRCIHHIVAALNAGGVATVACCCGHVKNRGRIDLEDGRVLLIVTTQEASELEVLTSPLAAAEDLRCPHCDESQTHESASVGDEVVCPGCGEEWSLMRTDERADPMTEEDLQRLRSWVHDPDYCGPASDIGKARMLLNEVDRLRKRERDLEAKLTLQDKIAEESWKR